MVHGKQLCLSTTQEPSWEKDLSEHIDLYKKWAVDRYPEWQSWRAGQIETSWENHRHWGHRYAWAQGKINDKWTGYSDVMYSYEELGQRTVEDTFKDTVLGLKEQIMNDERREIKEGLAHLHYALRLLPKNK